MRKAAIVLMVVGAWLFAVTAATAVAAPGKGKGPGGGGAGQEKVTMCHKGVTTIVVGNTRPPVTVMRNSCFSWFAPVVAAMQMSREGLAERARNCAATEGEGSRHVQRRASGFAASA